MKVGAYVHSSKGGGEGNQHGGGGQRIYGQRRFWGGGANQRISGRLEKIVWIGYDRGLWKKALS